MDLIVTIGGEDYDARDPSIGIWDGATGASISLFEGHRNAIRGVEFAPDGESFITWSWEYKADENVAKLWNSPQEDF